MEEVVIYTFLITRGIGGFIMISRLQKIIASRGYCSRRKAEELIELGKVKVDGITVDSLGSKFDEDKIVIEIEGKKLLPNT